MPKATSRKAGKAKNGDDKEPEENGSNLRRTLVVDVGGSRIKATVLNDLGKPVSERLRRESPASGKPRAVIDIIVGSPKNSRASTGWRSASPGSLSTELSKQPPTWRRNGRASTSQRFCKQS
jgi:polyphosphate glucokinase